MKILKWIGNPYLFVSLYLLLIIEGDHFGGFYLVYLLLAIPHGLSYSLLSIAGIAILLWGAHRNGGLRLLLVVSGLSLMIIALTVFFSTGNKNDSFLPGIPLLSFILCGISACAMLLNYFTSYYVIYNKKRSETF